MAFRYLDVGFDPDFVPYLDGLDLQERTHAAVVADQKPNTILMLEHESVYTAGRRTKDEDRPTDGAPVVDIDRGGEITWHGPGQLVAYPIVKLRNKAAVSDFVQALEDAIIRVLAEYGITTTVIEGRPGVWVPGDALQAPRKIAAIGLRIHLGVAKHGVAINCNNSFDAFAKIVPCGISDAGVTSIQAETGRNVSPAELAVRLKQEFDRLEPRIAAMGAPAATNPTFEGAHQ